VLQLGTFERDPSCATSIYSGNKHEKRFSSRQSLVSQYSSMICSRRETILGGKLTVCHRPETLWSEQLGKNFVQQMRDALQKQLSEFETAKKKEEHDARIVANDGARRWRELKDSLKRLVEQRK